MTNLISKSKTPNGPESIIRNLEDGPGYSPDWAGQVVDAYITEIVNADNESAALDLILKEEENNSIVRQTLLFHFGRECAIGTSIRYAIRCLQDEAASHTGSMIAAMVIAGGSVEQIAEVLRCKPEHISAYEQLFFDVRRYRECTPWLKNLCYRDQGPKSSEPYLTRWLVTAFERGWDGLLAMISKLPQQKSSLSDGLRIQQELERRLLARGDDYIKSLDMLGVPPNKEDLQRLCKFLTSEVARGRRFATSNYAQAETAAQESKTEPAETPASPEEILALLKRVREMRQPPKSDSTWGA